MVKGLAGISGDFADSQVGKAAAQVIKAWDGLQVVVAVGSDEGAGDGPVGKETVIKDIEGFGLVAEVVLTLGRSGFLFFLALL